MTQRPLTDDEKHELDALTAAVTAAIHARRDWLDAKMTECSSLQVGDDIYDLDSGSRLGTVSKLYRYWRDRDDLRDTRPACHYEYETGHRCFDNTSRQTGRRFGSKEDVAKGADGLDPWRMLFQSLNYITGGHA